MRVKVMKQKHKTSADRNVATDVATEEVIPLGGFRGEEELPPGGFRGEEELPPGGFRGKRNLPPEKEELPSGGFGTEEIGK